MMTLFYIHEHYVQCSCTSLYIYISNVTFPRTPLVQFLNYWGDPSPPPGSAPAVGVIWEKSSSLIIYSLQQVVSNKKGNNNGED